MVLAECFSDAGNLLMGTLTGIFLWITFYGSIRNGRTVAPDEWQRVKIGAKGKSSFLAKVADEFLDVVGGAAPLLRTENQLLTTGG